MSLLITGYAGTPHVTSAQQGACNAGLYGAGKYVLDIGSQFAYEVVTSNLIQIKDGYAMNQGRLMGIDNTISEELIIDNGLQGVKRADLICMKYTKNTDTGIEKAELVVIKGTSGDNYTDPSTVCGDILAGASEDDFPLYRVKIDGINIVAVEPLFHIMVSAKKIMDKLGATDISAMGDGTVTGAISAINKNLTKENIGLGNVNNTADAEKSVKYAASAGSANAVAWGNVNGKPSTFPPSAHGHTWNDVSGKPSTFPPSAHGHHIGIHEGASPNVLSDFVSELDLNSNKISTFRTNGAVSNVPMYGSGIAFRTGDTHGYLSMAYGGAEVYAGGGNGSGINWSTRLLTANDSCNKNWNWSGQGGQPSWLWGGEDRTNMFVYNPANFFVRTAQYMQSRGGSDSYSCVLTNSGNFRPESIADSSGNAMSANGVIGLGTGSYRWKQLYVSSSSISTSDRNLKDNIKPLTTQHLRFFMLLQPVSFTFRDGESGRTHIGFISQDVEAAMAACALGNLDFAGFCKDKRVVARIEKDDDGNNIEIEEDVLDENGNPTYIYSLRYEEFIALIAYVLQEAVSRMDEQESRMNELDEKIVMLEQKIAALQQT